MQIDTVKKYELDLPGIYQAKNILTVLQAVQLLSDYDLNKGVIENALKKTKQLTGLHGRWEVIHQKPTVVLEVAHNREGIAQMLKHIEKLSYNKLHLIFGVVKDKDVEQVLRLLPPTASYYFTQADSPRALDAKILQDEASKFSLQGNIHADVNVALQNALNLASPDDLVIVCGSIFLVAEVKR
jgi:dihydrofolate synthase/folylpolyglutamate synthase